MFLLLRLVAIAADGVARHAPRARSTVLRLAIANIHRPGALTPTIVLSLGLGLALLVTVIEIDGNLREQFTRRCRPRRRRSTSSTFRPSEAERFDAFVRSAGARRQARTRADAARPHRRGERRPRRRHQAEPDAAWVLQSDRGITYAARVPDGSRVVEGRMVEAGL